ncbi:hypothetical protein Q5424_28395 [Conexibacter sp. JD483]|uniref:hypothetical protein n=1 Tax=unclassified Conexibacter TaxID=2627773 RepID=UPI0027172E25|nr:MULTISPECIES: hypothetical protein [unclassified Conexibacter]MDO8186538.1 hypothetical protein [Conexibacter sp. CPCC 205706]MDO8200107.1 hypothetical protein [Conexibacter sp. CPCC 205762]MDR9373051.1 hypothetical protein [Conexibacter sp. JD483]
MAGHAKNARIVSAHLHTQVDAATTITRAGQAKVMVCTGGIGLLAIALFGRKPAANEIAVRGRTWLALLPESFVLIGSDPLRGRPRKEPIASISYREVAAVEATRKLITRRVTVTLHDGRAFSFEAPRLNNKDGAEAFELLRRRCLPVTAPASGAQVVAPL